MTFFAQLAEIAARKPELPWLFFRRDLDWCWRSHRQVADHLARCAAAITQAGLTAATALPWVSAESLSILLAGLAAGIRFEPLKEAGQEVSFLTLANAKWPELLPEGLDRKLLTLPAAHGNIARYDCAALPPGPYGKLVEPGREWTLEDLEQKSQRIAALLFDADEGDARDRERGQKIVHAGAKLGSAVAVALLMATLEDEGKSKGSKVLALEPYPPATVESLLWCRPTHILAQAEEIAALSAAWTKKCAKRSRLRRILTIGEVDPAWSKSLGVPVVAFS